MSERVTATVVNWNTAGFAFCEIPGQRERAFLHAKDTDNPNRILEPGNTVEAELTSTPKGLRLVRATILD